MNKTTYLLFATLIVSISSCGSKQPAGNVSTEDTTQTSPSHSNPIKDFDLWFEGTIGEKLMICMDLKNNSGKLTGTLNYQGQTGSLTIDGSIAENGKLTINEYNNKGKNTGIFKGELKDQQITGQWSKPDGTYSMNFNMYVSEGDETSCAGVHSQPSGEWTGLYTQKTGQNVQLKGPTKDGAITFTLKMPSKECGEGTRGTANLVNSSVAEYYMDNSECFIRFQNNEDGTIEIKTDQCGDLTCADWNGVYKK